MKIKPAIIWASIYWRGRGPGVGEVLLYHFTNEILTKSNFVLRTSIAFSWISFP